MHAHKCTVCAARGIQTIWIHGDQHADNKIAHKCPKCGSENWVKYMVEVAKLPPQQQQQQGVVQVLRLQDALMMAFTYAFLCLVIVAIAQNWERILSYVQKARQ